MRPPPGARGEGGQHTESTKGSGGITGMILPVYAVGIVVYLLYTASKVSLAAYLMSCLAIWVQNYISHF